MSEMSDRNTTRIEPDVAWTVVTESPLKGLAFAREAGRILAWDEGNQLYLLDRPGRDDVVSRVPQPDASSGAISDDGSLIALLCEHETPGCLLHERRFRRSRSERRRPAKASFVTTDPLGRYVAVGSRLGAVTLSTGTAGRRGGSRRSSRSRTCASSPTGRSWWGRRRSGCWSGSRSSRRAEAGAARAEIVWQDRLMSNVGRLTVSGDGVDDPGELLHARDPAVRPERPQRRARTTWAGRCRTRSRTSPAGRSRRRRSKGSWRS